MYEHSLVQRKVEDELLMDSKEYLHYEDIENFSVPHKISLMNSSAEIISERVWPCQVQF